MTKPRSRQLELPLSPFTDEPRARLIHYLRDLHEVWQDAYLPNSQPAASRRCQDCTRKRIPIQRRWRGATVAGDWDGDRERKGEVWHSDNPADRGAGAGYVEIHKRDGRAHYTGVVRCGKVWECPDCSACIKAERAAEVEKAKAWHVAGFGEDSAVMLTLTVRHGMGDVLKPVARGVAAAWRRFVSGKEWTAAKKWFGLVGFIRALEVTEGPAGWHPHHHVLLLLRVPPDANRRHELNGMGLCRHCNRVAPAADQACDAFAHYVFERWRAAVVHELGVDHEPVEFDPANPSRRVGVNVTRAADASYLAKLGLEISAPNTKRAHGANRTPLDILASLAATGDVSEAGRYADYVEGMRGLAQLRWSTGLKAAVAIEEQSDEAIVAGAHEEGDELVTRISPREHDDLCRAPGALTTALELAELHGAAGVNEFVKLTVRRVHDSIMADAKRRSRAAA